MAIIAADYESDVIAWANEQARLLRAGMFSQLDIEHIADEIEDVGKSEQLELTSRMVVLLAHLLKWQYQPAYRGNSWRLTIAGQRKDVAYALKKTLSLKAARNDPDWMDLVWSKAIGQAASETGLDCFPQVCPWTFEQIMDSEFWPSNPG